MRNLKTIFMIAILALFLAAPAAFAQDWEISTADQLKAFRDAVNTSNDVHSADKAVLLNDIDLEGSATNQWTPIGIGPSRSFKGTFDGRGHTVSGLYIDASVTTYPQGLFGMVIGGVIKNLTVSGSVTGKTWVGGVVGTVNRSTVTNCLSTCSVTGSDKIGGVAGWIFGGGTVTNSVSSCDVTGTSEVGGVAGYIYDGTVTNCAGTGSVTGSDKVGGVAGYIYGGTVTNCGWYYKNAGYVSGDKSIGYEEASVTSRDVVSFDKVEDIAVACLPDTSSLTVDGTGTYKLVTYPSNTADFAKHISVAFTVSPDIATAANAERVVTVTGKALGNGTITNNVTLKPTLFDGTFNVTSGDIELTLPVALKVTALPPDPTPGGGSSGGCNAGFAGLLLLAAVPFVVRRKK